MQVVAGSDRAIDSRPGTGEEGGHLVAAGMPRRVAAERSSRTARYLTRFLSQASLAAGGRSFLCMIKAWSTCL